MPALEGEPARLGVPGGGIQGRQVGLQGPAEQRRSSSMPAQCLSCLSPGCCTEVGVQQMGSQGKAEARGGKTSRQTNEPKRHPNPPAQSLVQQAWGVPGPGRAPGGRRARPGAAGGHHPPAFARGRGQAAPHGRLPGAPEAQPRAGGPQSSWDVKRCKGTLKLLKSTTCFRRHGHTHTTPPPPASLTPVHPLHAQRDAREAGTDVPAPVTTGGREQDQREVLPQHPNERR